MARLKFSISLENVIRFSRFGPSGIMVIVLGLSLNLFTATICRGCHANNRTDGQNPKRPNLKDTFIGVPQANGGLRDGGLRKSEDI